MTRAARAEAGDLVVVSALPGAKLLTSGKLISRQACPTPSAAGEFYRLVFAGEAERLRDGARAAAAVRAFFVERGFVEV
ncbi:MAG TPA: hypothetical protein VNG33_09735, partial [Polyangiaceae bacterium]|nr:hypothetical protein [Polyangiaceae bacterium]